MDGRQQHVVLGNSSRWVNVMSGEPQGSVFGPPSYLELQEILADDSNSMQDYIIIMPNLSQTGLKFATKAQYSKSAL